MQVCVLVLIHKSGQRVLGGGVLWEERGEPISLKMSRVHSCIHIYIFSFLNPQRTKVQNWSELPPLSPPNLNAVMSKSL